MTRNELDITRRKLLAAGTGTTLLGLGTGAFASLASGRVQHDWQFQVEGQTADLRVNWAEWYNRTKLEEQSASVSADGPVLTLRNVVPGDSGRLHFGLTVDLETIAADRSQVTMQLLAPEDSFAENGLTEPEIAADDRSPNRGELQEHVRFAVWYDVGIVVEGVQVTGQCDGTRDVTEPLIARGTLAEVSAALGDGILLDAKPGTPGTDCLTESDELCIGVEWWLPTDVGGIDDNLVQSDSVEVDLGFRAKGCESGGNAE